MRQREQHDLGDAIGFQGFDRGLDMADHPGDQRFYFIRGLDGIGRVSRFEIQIVVVADVEDRFATLGGLVAMQAGDESLDLDVEIDRDRVDGLRAGAAERVILDVGRFYVQQGRQLFGVSRAVRETALPPRRGGNADQVKQIAVVGQAVTEKDEVGNPGGRLVLVFSFGPGITP